MKRLLSYDMLAGRKMDIYRLFGIGQDTLGTHGGPVRSPPPQYYNVPDTTAYVTHLASGNLNFFPLNCTYKASDGITKPFLEPATLTSAGCLMAPSPRRWLTRPRMRMGSYCRPHPQHSL